MVAERDDSELTSAMRDEETWWHVDELTHEPGRRRLREFLLRQELEDSAASRMLAELLGSRERFEAARIRDDARFRTAGVVRLLCETVRMECDHDPRFALVLAETACAIAEALPDDSEAAGIIHALRGNAWKEYSTTCRYMGRFKEAAEAIERSHRSYERLSDPEPYLASVELARAILLWFQDEFAEALTLARSAARRYEERGETTHYLEAREMQGGILYRWGNVPAALEIYRATYQAADEIDDVAMKARTARNLGLIIRNGGDIATASKYFLTALQLFEGLGQDAMVVHTRHSIAWLAMAAGNFEEAARRLTEVATEFAKLEMSFDAAMARLDRAEALVMLGRCDEAYPICSELVGYFSEASVIQGALTAAALLKEAIANRSLSQEHIRSVRACLRSHPDKGTARELFLLA